MKTPKKILLILLALLVFGAIFFIPAVGTLLFSLLGILLLLILVVLFCPIKYSLTYNSEEKGRERMQVKLRLLLFYAITFYPFEAKAKPKNPPQKAKIQTKKPPSEKATEKIETEDLKKGLTLIQEILPTLTWFVRKLLRQISIWHFDLAYGVHREDAAQTAIAYSHSMMIVMPFLSVLQEYITIKIRNIDIFPDFNPPNHKSRCYLYFKGQIIPMAFLIISIALLIKLFPFFKGILKNIIKKEG